MVKTNKVNRTTEAQLKTLYPSEMAPYQILGGKAVKNIQIDPQTTELWLNKIQPPNKIP